MLYKIKWICYFFEKFCVRTKWITPLYTTAPGIRRSLAKTAKEIDLSSSSKLATPN